MAKWRGWGAWEPEGLFEPFVETPVDEEEFRALYRGLPGSAAVVWNPESPILLCAGGEPQLVATHRAPSEEGEGGATAAELAARAAGRRTWGILRGDVDEFSARLGRAQTVEEYIQLSVFYRQLLAGEVQVQCTQGGFWQKLSVLYTGGDEFAVIGGWDALLPFAREIERVFHRSAESFLQEFPGPEGKTISMALVLAPSAEASVASVYAEAGRQLEIAKSSGKDSISVMGRVLDWKQLTEAAELKQTMLRLVTEFGCSPQFLGELGAFYRETDRVLPAKSARRLNEAQQRPWRLHRRLNRVLETVDERQREFHKARNAVVSAFLTRGQAQLKLKPSGRVALEWARTLQDSE
jgi:CRISPR-associated protein Csm1